MFSGLPANTPQAATEQEEVQPPPTKIEEKVKEQPPPCEVSMGTHLF